MSTRENQIQQDIDDWRKELREGDLFEGVKAKHRRAIVGILDLAQQALDLAKPPG